MSNYHEKYAQITVELRKRLKLRKHGGIVPFIYRGIANRDTGYEYDIADRAERIRLIDAITADYMREHSEYVAAGLAKWERDGYRGQRPKTQPVNSAILESLADAILDEELTDMNEHKVSQTEYPFLSATQLEERRNREFPLKIAEEVGTDGADYRIPTRKKRPKRDIKFRDRDAHKRNRERSAQYKRDTSPGPITPRVTEAFVQCRGISDAWRRYIAQETEICEV
ncbi:hypothetical protein [Paenibacillus sp. YN15]|uniref:hypothetical protein n=1 Tax=Paenibacillus sp. YN15 TaxID=1742774 RepID=UPI000DCEE37D|nr:hypothetical protein [Paenibacillus sp. YN15]RAU96828.1 hypothetical protein DQG13_19940 [Paenibacillus sp. YN15]